MLNDPGPGEPAAETPDSMPVDPESGSEDSGGGEDTAFLPATLFPEMPKPGKVCSFKVVSVDDGQVEVRYEHSSGGEGYEGKPGMMEDFDQKIAE